MKKSKSLLASILLLLVFLASCSKSNMHFKGVAHTHPYHIQIGHVLSSKEKEQVKEVIAKVFNEVDTMYNHWNPNSLLSKEPTSPKLLPILMLAHHYKKLTKGRFDPGLGVQLKLFKTHSKLPSGYYPKVYDLDGMLKGFAIDRITSELTEKGYTNMFIEWGGDIRVQGHHPNKRKWKILVDHTPIEVEDGAFATSGCEEQMWDIEDTTYTHIIDPLSGAMLKVENGMVHKVTVKAPTCALADALATATMACGNFEDALKFAEEVKEEHDVAFWIQSWDIKQ